MSSIDTISSIMEKYGVADTKARTTGGSDLSKDAFLNLMVTQLKYQDPLEPTKDKEFLAQMAQFTSLEQMQNLNASFNLQQANGMIDKTVIAEVTNPLTFETKTVTGIVSSVTMKNSVPYLVVNGQEIEVKSVKQVVGSTDKNNKDIVDAVTKLTNQVTSLQQQVAQLLADKNTTTL